MPKLIIPEWANITIDVDKLEVQGPGGSLTLKIPTQLKITRKDNFLLTQIDDQKNKALVGTISSLFFNILEGVKAGGGYEKSLEIKGAGYKVNEIKEKEKHYLEFSLGYSHLINLAVPSNLKVKCLGNNKITIWGTDKQQVGWFAAKIRDFRLPSKYKKDKGIYYSGEEKIIKKKAVKK